LFCSSESESFTEIPLTIVNPLRKLPVSQKYLADYVPTESTSQVDVPDDQSMKSFDDSDTENNEPVVLEHEL
jgi:hypothetical protein